MLSICSCMLSTFSIKSLSILIIVFKNSCLIILTFSPYLTLVLMLVQSLPTDFLSFSMPCNFLLNGVHDVLGKGTAVIKTLIMKWQGKCGGEAFYSSMIRSQPLVSLCLWTVNFTNVPLSLSLFPPLVNLDGYRRLELGISLPPGKLCSDNTLAG